MSRNRLLPAVGLACLLLSGCMGSAPFPTTSVVPIKLTPPVARPESPAEETVSFIWTTRQTLGDHAFFFSFDHGNDNSCDSELVLAGKQQHAGPFAIQLWQGRSHDSTSNGEMQTTGEGHVVWARAGPIHEGGDPFGRFGEYAITRAQEATYDGVSNWTLFAAGLESWSHRFGDQSASFRVECEKPFRVVETLAGPARLFDGRSLKAGFSGDFRGQNVGAYAGVLDSLEFKTEAPASYIYFGANSGVVGRFELRTPTQSRTIDVLGLPVHTTLASGPGTLRIEANATAVQGGFSGALYGLFPDLPDDSRPVAGGSS